MATVGEISDRVIRTNAQGFSESSDVWPVIDEVVDILYKQELPQTLYIDSTTGRPPLLETTDETYEYDGPVGTWRVSNILLIGYDSGRDYNLETADVDTLINYNEPIVIAGIRFYPYYQITTTDALEGERPKVRFSFNPGDTTDLFYVQAYKTPARVKSDRVQIPIPDANGAHWRIVLPCVLKLIEAQNNGNYVEAYEYIEAMRGRLRNILCGGAQGRTHRVTCRPW